ncbi:hypothetical protein D3OALGA1CA_1428 [Olavius algarvensis associated proteobacterium Delta 3]|nr:hypothetical protein D3OALGB2SA_876 [Olavius algarvensis associated proteobacterium Delta 3]CAB5101076.1 hypothetical protein D3OALGA1CA_1428 [Olavius algarvensis associated proteobacterium Delta 3]
MNLRNRKALVVCALAVAGIFCLSVVPSLHSADPGKDLLKRFNVFKPKEPLIPENVKISPDFKPGTGPSIGTVQKIQGTAYVIHQNQMVAYTLKNNFLLYQNDTLVTGKRSRINAIMNDRSVLALAPHAKLVLTQIEYDPDTETRSTFMNLLWGSVRFIVQKVKGKPNFRVKTPTAVAGVRGTDFALSVTPISDKMSSLERFLAAINPVREAHAQVIGIPLITTALTGTGSTVGLTGAVGGTAIVGPASVAGAVTGAAAGGATVVGATAAAGVLGSVGPGLATLAMPPEFD